MAASDQSSDEIMKVSEVEDLCFLIHIFWSMLIAFQGYGGITEQEEMFRIRSDAPLGGLATFNMEYAPNFISQSSDII